MGAALAALMNRKKVREPLSLRASMLEQVLGNALNDAQKGLLGDFIESYFKLAADEARRFRHIESNKEYRKMEGMEKEMEEEFGLTWSDGIALEAKCDTLLNLLTKKFGPLSEKVIRRVGAIDSLEDADAYIERVLTASSLGEMELG